MAITKDNLSSNFLNDHMEGSFEDNFDEGAGEFDLDGDFLDDINDQDKNEETDKDDSKPQALIDGDILIDVHADENIEEIVVFHMKSDENIETGFKKQDSSPMLDLQDNATENTQGNHQDMKVKSFNDNHPDVKKPTTEPYISLRKALIENEKTSFSNAR